MIIHRHDMVHHDHDDHDNVMTGFIMNKDNLNMILKAIIVHTERSRKGDTHTPRPHKNGGYAYPAFTAWQEEYVPFSYGLW